MLNICEELKSCCNAFLRDEQETDAMNYVSVLNQINGIIRDAGMSNAVSIIQLLILELTMVRSFTKIFLKMKMNLIW